MPFRGVGEPGARRTYPSHEAPRLPHSGRGAQSSTQGQESCQADPCVEGWVGGERRRVRGSGAGPQGRAWPQNPPGIEVYTGLPGPWRDHTPPSGRGVPPTPAPGSGSPCLPPASCPTPCPPPPPRGLSLKPHTATPCLVTGGRARTAVLSVQTRLPAPGRLGLRAKVTKWGLGDTGLGLGLPPDPAGLGVPTSTLLVSWAHRPIPASCPRPRPGLGPPPGHGGQSAMPPPAPDKATLSPRRPVWAADSGRSGTPGSRTWSWEPRGPLALAPPTALAPLHGGASPSPGLVPSDPGTRRPSPTLAARSPTHPSGARPCRGSPLGTRG